MSQTTYLLNCSLPQLRMEQDCAQQLEREKKLLEAQVKDMQTRVDEAQAQALKGGKKAMNKMDTRIRELESEMDAENRRMADAQKNMRKSERRIKELVYQQDEDKKNHERMQALIDQLQGKIKIKNQKSKIKIKNQKSKSPHRPTSRQNQVLQEANRGG